MKLRLLFALVSFKIFKNSKKYTKRILSVLLPEGKLKENQRLETEYFAKINLYENDNVVKEVNLPRELNIDDFLNTVDETVKIKRLYNDRYTNEYTWKK